VVLSQFVLAEADVGVGHFFVGLRVVLDVLLIAANGLRIYGLPKVLVPLVLQIHDYIKSTVQTSIIESIALGMTGEVLFGESMIVGVQAVFLDFLHSQRRRGNVVES
jgi:hypothetical protein